MPTHIIILLILFGLFIVSSYIYAKKTENRHTYICLKTGDEYRIYCYGKLKDPQTRKWVSSVNYYSLKTQDFYTRESNDFFDRFMLKSEYLKQKKNKTNENCNTSVPEL